MLGFLPLYNLVSAACWFYILFLVISEYPYIGQPQFFMETKDLVTYIQCGAIIEVFNSLLGLVRSSVITTAAQVASRLLVVIGIFQYIPEAENAHKIYYISLLFAWSLTETVRYSFYFFNLVGEAPKIIKLLRYNMFWILYPLGVGSELSIIYSALLPAAEKYGPSVRWFLLISMISYAPGFPVLFSHMIAQRKSVMKSLKNKTKTN